MSGSSGTVSAQYGSKKSVSLSVVVASYNSHETLSRCLESLSRQPTAREIVVADCSLEDPAKELKARFPKVRFLHFAEPRTIPELRWEAYRHTSGEVVAATEGRCVPAADWCDALLEAHSAAPEAPAVGGPIALQAPATAFDWGVYFCEYGWHCPPPTERVVRLASGANISYKRAALDRSRDLIEAACWETQFHERWLKQGMPLRMADANVMFENRMRPGDVVRQRFHYGRGYGADRVAGAGVKVRLGYAARCPLLPVVLPLRLGRIAARRGHGRPFLRALAWVVSLSAVWAAGEMTGYLFRHAANKRVF